MHASDFANLFPQATRKYLEDDRCYLDSGKVTVLLRMLDEYINAGRKVLVFSQVSFGFLLT